MTVRPIIALAVGAVISVLAPASFGQIVPPPAPAPDSGAIPDTPPADDVEILTRGPVHEAFAEQYNANPEPGIIVAKVPPENIDELPPDAIPEGENVQWMPGYWGLDDNGEFIWISGFWRDVPPGQRWIPGYWQEVDGGYQWVSGFWAPDDTAELDYLPQPPASLEQGPNIAAPSDNHFWVPGCWVYNSGYQWQAGYWAPSYDNYMWIPNRNIWTPYGYVYRPGYWDYRLPFRGTLFAPVRFGNLNWWYGPNRFFTPGFTIAAGPLALHLFVRPSYGHYYFGDYYGSNYLGLGISPWYTFNQYRYGYGYGYDPLLTFYVGYHRRHNHINYIDRLSSWNNYYQNNPNYRPPHNAHDLREFNDRHHDDDDRVRQIVRNASLGDDLETVVARSDHDGHQFRKVDSVERQRVRESSREVSHLADLRRNQERGSPQALPAVESPNGGNRSSRSGGQSDHSHKTLRLPGAVAGADRPDQHTRPDHQAPHEPPGAQPQVTGSTIDRGRPSSSSRLRGQEGNTTPSATLPRTQPEPSGSSRERSSTSRGSSSSRERSSSLPSTQPQPGSRQPQPSSRNPGSNPPKPSAGTGPSIPQSGSGRGSSGSRGSGGSSGVPGAGSNRGPSTPRSGSSGSSSGSRGSGVPGSNSGSRGPSSPRSGSSSSSSGSRGPSGSSSGSRGPSGSSGSRGSSGGSPSGSRGSGGSSPKGPSGASLNFGQPSIGNQSPFGSSSRLSSPTSSSSRVPSSAPSRSNTPSFGGSSRSSSSPSFGSSSRSSGSSSRSSFGSSRSNSSSRSSSPSFGGGSSSRSSGSSSRSSSSRSSGSSHSHGSSSHGSSSKKH